MEEERKKPQGGIPKKPILFFKLFCYIRPESVTSDSIEASFMFEQVCLCDCVTHSLTSWHYFQLIHAPIEIS